MANTSNIPVKNDVLEVIDTLSIDTEKEIYLLGHEFSGMTVLPGFRFVAEILQTHERISDIEFLLVYPIGSEGRVKLSVISNKSTLEEAKKTNGKAEFDNQFYEITDSATGASHMRYRLSSADHNGMTRFVSTSIADFNASDETDGENLYKRLSSQGNNYGKEFRRISRLNKTKDYAVATLHRDNNLDAIQNIVTILDSCTHAASELGDESKTYHLSKISELSLNHPIDYIASSAERLFVRLIERSNDSCVFDFQIVDQQGHRLVTCTGMELRYHKSPRAVFGSVAFASTFTLDPITKAFEYWSNVFGKNIDIKLADYGQVFQTLLSKEGVFNAAVDRRIVLFRVQDLIDQNKPRLTIIAPEALKDIENVYSLPDGNLISHLNKYETDYLFNEIFVDCAYRRHGVGICDNDTVIDIGANIGLFSLFASNEAKNVKVIAVEPSPVVLPILTKNLEAYLSDYEVYEAGASDSSGKAEFTAYKYSSVFSSFSADNGDKEAIKAVIRNMLRTVINEDDKNFEETVEQLLSDRLSAETYNCELVSVNEIIENSNLNSVGLLKIDAEKSEEAILEGVSDANWKLIDQVIIEVHNQSGLVAPRVHELLQSKGFEIIEDEEEFLLESGLTTLYAIKPHRITINSVRNGEEQLIKNCNLFVDAVRAHCDSTNNELDIVLCPSNSIDPVVNALISKAEQLVTSQLQDLVSVNVQFSSEYNKNYPVSDLFDRYANISAHIPYTDDWYIATASAAIRKHVVKKSSLIKVLVLDCDNTLWDGIVGEDGVENIVITPARQEFHRFINRLIEHGVLVCLASKNDLEIVEKTFKDRKDLLLNWDDLIVKKINWQPKSQNIYEIANDLNLGLDSFVFVDDSGLECAEVRSALPAVVTIQMPVSEDSIVSFFENMWLFDREAVTQEDKLRSQLYKDENNRKEVLHQTSSISEFIKELNLITDIKPVTESEIPRIAQMTQRTNQFNFSTKRKSESEVEALVDSNQNVVRVKVSDRFGDYGITGLAIFGKENDYVNIDTFLLSCRVLGRGVENSVLDHIISFANENNLSKIRHNFKKTDRNQPALNFLRVLDKGNASEKLNDFIDISDLDNTKLDVSRNVYGNQSNKESMGSEYVKNIENVKPDAAYLPDVIFEKIAYDAYDINNLKRLISVKVKRNRPSLNNSEIPPINKLQESLAKIWCDIIGLKSVGIEDNFFQLGGTSLDAVSMVGRIQKELGETVSVVSLFESPTISHLASVINRDSLEAGEDAIESIQQRAASRRSAKSRRTRIS